MWVGLISINAVKAIFRMTDEGCQDGPATICRRMVVGGENPPDDILFRLRNRTTYLASAGPKVNAFINENIMC